MEIFFLQPDELVKRLQELENSATQDAIVREKIANLPTEVTDPTYIDKVGGEVAYYIFVYAGLYLQVFVYPGLWTECGMWL